MTDDVESVTTIQEQFVREVAVKLARGKVVQVTYPDGSGYLYEPYLDANGKLCVRTTATKSQPL